MTRDPDPGPTCAGHRLASRRLTKRRAPCAQSSTPRSWTRRAVRPLGIGMRPNYRRPCLLHPHHPELPATSSTGYYATMPEPWHRTWANKLTDGTVRKLTDPTGEDRRALSPLFWANVNPCGRFRLDMESRLDLGIAA